MKSVALIVVVMVLGGWACGQDTSPEAQQKQEQAASLELQQCLNQIISPQNNVMNGELYCGLECGPTTGNAWTNCDAPDGTVAVARCTCCDDTNCKWAARCPGPPQCFEHNN